MWKKMWFLKSGHFLSLLHAPVLMLTCPLLVLSEVDMGQHGHPDWSVALRTILNKFWCSLSIRTFSAIFFSYTGQPSLNVNQWALAIHEPVTASPLFLGQLLINTDHWSLWTPHESCNFRDVMTQSSSHHSESNSLKSIRLPIFSASSINFHGKMFTCTQIFPTY